jgi:hypothetical protein
VHPVTVTPLEDNKFLVRVTYQPFKIQSRVDDEGVQKWFDLQNDLVTPASQQLGELINDYHGVLAEL